MRPWCFGASGSVRATSMHHFASCASVVHTFCPVTTQPPLRFTARVFSDARSEPASGSEKPWHQISSAGQDRLEVALLLLLGAVRDHDRAAHHEAEHVRDARRLGAHHLLVEDRLLDQRRAAAAVLLRPRHAGPAGLVQLALPAPRELEAPRRRPPGSRPDGSPPATTRTSSRKASSLGLSVRSTSSSFRSVVGCARPAGSACRCRGRRRSTSSRGRSPCRCARARAAAS